MKYDPRHDYHCGRLYEKWRAAGVARIYAAHALPPGMTSDGAVVANIGDLEAVGLHWVDRVTNYKGSAASLVVVPRTKQHDLPGWKYALDLRCGTDKASHAIESSVRLMGIRMTPSRRINLVTRLDRDNKGTASAAVAWAQINQLLELIASPLGQTAFGRPLNSLRRRRSS